jgi:hypothetical protein
MATMDDLDKLPPDLVWQQDGHLSDIVLASIGDGEVDIVPPEASSHLDHCDHCTTRFGAEALLSKHAGELLAEVSRNMDHVPAVVTPRSIRVVAAEGFANMPKRAILGALFLAAIGSMPAILSHGHWRIAQFIEILSRSIVMLSRSMVLVAKSGSFTVLVWASAMILMVLGLVVSRSARRGLVNGLVEERSL